MKKEDFIEIYKTYSVEALSEMLHDNIMMYEKKVDNLHKALSELMGEVERLRDYGIETINKMDGMYESQMQVAEGEINRLNIIIDFFYMRGRE